MSKKSFRGGIDTILGESNQDEVQVKSESLVKTTRKPDAPQPGEKRATFHISENTLEKVKAIAYWERLTIKEVVNDAFADYVAKYERKQGTIESIPKKTRK